MKLTLFSTYITKEHIIKFKEIFKKDLKEVKVLYITTAGNYKPFKSEWQVELERLWISIFPQLREFDLEHAYNIDNNFDFKKHFMQFDYIFVAGGNTFILSYWINKTGADKILRDMIIKDKVIYGGSSAGAVYAFKDLMPYSVMDDPAKAPQIVKEGLDIIDFAPLPHWDVQDFKEASVNLQKSFDSKGIKTIPINDTQGVFVINNKISII